MKKRKGKKELKGNSFHHYGGAFDALEDSRKMQEMLQKNFIQMEAQQLDKINKFFKGQPPWAPPPGEYGGWDNGFEPIPPVGPAQGPVLPDRVHIELTEEEVKALLNGDVVLQTHHGVTIYIQEA